MSRIFFALVALAHLVLVCKCSVVGCGGFVKAGGPDSSSSFDAVDFQSVTVELLSKDGVLKDSTVCAPNGYYFLPLYSKGSFKLSVRGPKGWKFEPSELVITDKQCASGDIDFQFTGFSLSGYVSGHSAAHQSCNVEEIGPSGVTVSLNSLDGVTIQSVVTQNGGFYDFPNVYPGSYHLSSSHPSWDMIKDTISVTMGWGNLVVEERMEVEGYSIKGRITSHGEAVKDVTILIETSGGDVKSLSCSSSGSCSTTSDNDGYFTFTSIPCGAYTLSPVTNTTTTEYSFSPSTLLVNVGHGDAMVNDGSHDAGVHFELEGFTSHGRVVDSQGIGVSGVSIIVDGQERCVTDSHGRYTLERMQSIRYDLDASKDHVFFNALLGFKITPQSPDFPDVQVAAYHLCGRVDVLSLPDLQPRLQREISLTPVGSSSGAKERRHTENSGAYCFEVTPGVYDVTPVVSEVEKRQGLQFHPPTQRVEISSLPSLDVDFRQSVGEVRGTVEYIPLPDGLSSSVVKVTVTLESDGRLPITSVLDVPKDGRALEFQFTDVLPGRYKVRVSQPAWCWKQETLEAMVPGDSVLAFVQKGFRMTTLLSHSARFLLKYPDGTEEEVDMQHGENSMCLERAGVYRLSPRSCYRYGRDTYLVDTSTLKGMEVLDLTVSHYAIHGRIECSLEDTQPPAISVIVGVTRAHTRRTKIGGGDEVDGSAGGRVVAIDGGTITPRASSPPENNGSHWHHVLEYSVWGAPGDRISFSPSADGLLFYPQTLMVDMTGGSTEACPPPVGPMRCRPAQYVVGRVTPAMQGVTVKVYPKVMDGDDGVVVEEHRRHAIAETQTLVDGSYRAGPLYDTMEYVVEAHRPGYHVAPDPDGDAGDFIAMQLGSIRVLVREHHDGGGLPIAETLLSLSGPSYRSNNVTGDEGTLVFSGLHPGAYFLQAKLREYTLEPSSLALDVESGTVEHVELVATRHSYSCFGRVSAPNGDPEAHIEIEALLMDTHHHHHQEEEEHDDHGERDDGSARSGRPPPSGVVVEQATTRTDGSYRLRGLRPGHRYQVRIDAANGRIERAHPHTHVVDVKEQADVKEVDFVIFRSPSIETLSLTGDVSTTRREWLDTLVVELYAHHHHHQQHHYQHHYHHQEANAMDSPVLIATQQLGPCAYFDFPGLRADAEYTLRVVSSLSARTHIHRVVEHHIERLSRTPATQTSGGSPARAQHVHLEFDVEQRQLGEAEERGSAVGGIIVGIVVLIVSLFYEYVKAAARNIIRGR